MQTAASRPPALYPLEIARPVVHALAGGFMALGVGIALLWPQYLGLFFAAAFLVVLVMLCFAFPVLACVAWLLAVGLTPDMWLGEMLAAGAASAIVGALKLVGLFLVAICILRYGPALDWFNPGFAFAAMFGWGLVHGLHPSLDAAESLRSLLGSAAPFAFCFVRLPRRWARGVIHAVLWLPLLSVAVGACLALAGLRPLIVEGAGLRLQGAGHPAFLAAFAMVACYAALTEFLRAGQWRDAALLAMNFSILLLTGARAPLAITAMVIGLSLVFVPAPNLPMLRRLPLLLGGAVALVVLALLSGVLADLRIFTLLATEAGNLSGRDEIWPLFQAAWDKSPWLGWGVGAGKMLVAVDSPLAQLLGTNAAHNEYLRIGVDGGYLGLGLLALLFVLWAFAHLRVMRGSGRLVVLLVLIGFAVHSYTDNTLIATTASVLFAWITAVFARGAREADARDRSSVHENALS